MSSKLADEIKKAFGNATDLIIRPLLSIIEK